MDIPSYPQCMELLNTPHALIAGTTGSGKSVMLNSTIITGAAEAYCFYFFDLKRVELRRYKRLASCMGYVTEPEKVVPALDKIIGAMEQRYKEMRNKTETSEQHLYVVIDELADCVTIKGVLERLVKIGRLGRAAHIHLLCATQDPSRRTLPAQLMQNFTLTLALRCRSAIESRQIIGIPGAEKLPLYGKGIIWDAYGTHSISVPLTPPETLDYCVNGLTWWAYIKYRLFGITA